MSYLIMLINMLSVKIAICAFFIVVAKFVTKRVGIQSVDRWLMNIHKPAGCVLFVAGLIHMVFSFHVVSTTPIIGYVLGFICMFAIIALIATCVLRRKLGEHWLVWHRIMTAIAITTVILHTQIVEPVPESHYTVYYIESLRLPENDRNLIVNLGPLLNK
ncbi:hypothetical protein [Desulfosporosinus fructosivorans]